MKLCPHCNNSVNYLEYQETSYRQGIFNVISEEFIVENDSRNNDDCLIEYTCPECSKELEPEDLLEEMAEEDNNTEENI